MPSFPTSVFTPTSKSAGQIIEPSHINDLQNEVVAIEGGYINGTAPLNSSNSTVNSLTVSSRASFPGMERCLLRTATQQDLANGVVVAINWETETDVGGLHSTTAGVSSQVVIPVGSSGTYLMRLWVQFAANATGEREIRIHANGNENSARLAQNATTGIHTMNLVSIQPLDAGSTLVAFATQNSGSTGSIANVLTCAFDVCKLY